LIATSNKAPHDLYEGGLDRDVHLPPLAAAICDNCNVLHHSSDVDYRKLLAAATGDACVSKWQCKSSVESQAFVDTWWAALAGTSDVSPTPVGYGRQLPVLARGASSARDSASKSSAPSPRRPWAQQTTLNFANSSTHWWSQMYLDCDQNLAMRRGGGRSSSTPATRATSGSSSQPLPKILRTCWILPKMERTLTMGNPCKRHRSLLLGAHQDCMRCSQHLTRTRAELVARRLEPCPLFVPCCVQHHVPFFGRLAPSLICSLLRTASCAFFRVSA